MTTQILDTASDKQAFYLAKPALIKRIQSTLIDTIVIFVLMLLASKAINLFGVESGKLNISLLALILLYEPICTSIGQTVGQKIMGLRVSRLDSYLNQRKAQNINILISFARYMSKILLGWISLLTIHSDKYGQALHDKVSNSVMVYA